MGHIGHILRIVKFLQYILSVQKEDTIPYLPGWWFEPLWKNISQLGWLFPIYGRIKFMFQTANQLHICSKFAGARGYWNSLPPAPGQPPGLLNLLDVGKLFIAALVAPEFAGLYPAPDKHGKTWMSTFKLYTRLMWITYSNSPTWNNLGIVTLTNHSPTSQMSQWVPILFLHLSLATFVETSELAMEFWREKLT